MKHTRPASSTFSVSKGYKPRRVSRGVQTSTEPRTPKSNPVEKEILKFLADEIVFAMIDTVRVFAYLHAGVVGEARVRATMRKYTTYDQDYVQDGMSAAEQRA
jgi:hypothetical protein